MTITRITALLLALTLTHCAQNPVTGNPNLVLLSESQEIAIGRREDTNVRKQYGAYDDARLQQVVGEAARFKQASTRTAQAGLTFAELARRSPLGRFSEGHLRVINGLYPAGEPVAGQPLKIIE